MFRVPIATLSKNCLKLVHSKYQLVGISQHHAVHRYNFQSKQLTRFSSNKNEDDANKTVTEFADVPGVQTGGDKMILMYTCKVCDTRSAKKISKHSYEKGVVIVKCGNCSSMHLIADNLGVFEDPGWNIHKFLTEQGESSKLISNDNVLELNKNDILGIKNS